MTAPKRKTAPLSDVERTRLVWLARMIEDGSSPPFSSGDMTVVHVDLAQMSLALRDQFLDILRRAGEPTPKELGKIASRVARRYMNEHPDASPTDVATATLTELHVDGPKMYGATFGAPTPARIRSLADSLAPSKAATRGKRRR